jgi:SAM-dependent methyltransferase
MSDVMLRFLGWRSLLIHGDPSVFDRWLWLRTHLRGGAARTFDAGCGNGGFSFYAEHVGNDVLAASFSEREQADVRRRADSLGVNGIQLRTIDLRMLEEHRGELGLFDQIICFETIEHVNADQDLVESLVAMLAPEGRLLLSAPYEAHHPLYSEERYPSTVEDGFHVRYGYSPEGLREIAERAGLEVTSQGFISGVVSQKLTNLMRRLEARLGLPAAWAIMLPLRTLAILDAPLSRILRYPYLSVALCGVKRAAAPPDGG